MSSKCPSTFDEELYISWHEQAITKDKNLVEKINKLRDELRNEAKEAINNIAEIIMYLVQYCEGELNTVGISKIKASFESPLLNPPNDYNIFFKPTSSILNKLWRMNKERSENYAQISNLKKELKDLIRTSVVASTLFHGKFFSDRLRKVESIIHDNEKKDKWLKNIKSITVDEEMKMASGYFAFHGIISFENDINIEVQIYSKLTSTWRNLSHNLYEKVRSAIRIEKEMGSPESRLISLGHLLYLAESEIERLQKELKNYSL